MRLFALSDVHVDYEANKCWVRDLSNSDYRDDVLILAGDISDSLPELQTTLDEFSARFRQVLFVPGNHELWINRDRSEIDSLVKFEKVCQAAENCGATTQVITFGHISVVPLFSWYDFTFGEVSRELRAFWMDFRACRWPREYSVFDVASHFLDLNRAKLTTTNEVVVSFSHFVPRLDVIPPHPSRSARLLQPVLGSSRIEAQIRELRSNFHIYGHSHINHRIDMDGITYINNAVGYPHESRPPQSQLSCLLEA